MGNIQKQTERKYIGELAFLARREQGWTMAFLLQKLKKTSSLFATWDISRISRIEHGKAGLAVEDAPLYAKALGKPQSYFSDKRITPPAGSEPVSSCVDETASGLPQSLPLLIRELQVRLDKLEFAEVPLVEISTLPDDFYLQQPTGQTIRVCKRDLAGLNDSILDQLLAILLSTDIGEGFGINKKDYVVLNHHPDETDGRLYLFFFHDLMMIRRLYWTGDKVRLENHDGTNITANRKEVSMSGEIIISGRWTRHLP